MRFGLCCLFHKEPVRFRTTTVTALSRFSRADQLQRLSGICMDNTHSLLRALETVQRLGIGAFRIMSPLFPRMTHPEAGYRLNELPDAAAILHCMDKIREFRMRNDIRLSLHPDQFVVLSSPRPEVVANSVRELEHQGVLAELTGAEVITIHGGGVYGDKEAALARFRGAFCTLSERVRVRLALENDDTGYTVRDLLPTCQQLSIPLVYDVHHHRCNPDGLPEIVATELAGRTWQKVDREQYCHISSPRSGWTGGNPKPHADCINPLDVPECWQGREMTVDVEAKAKEVAVMQLMQDLRDRFGVS